MAKSWKDRFARLWKERNSALTHTDGRILISDVFEMFAVAAFKRGVPEIALERTMVSTRDQLGLGEGKCVKSA